MNTQLHRYVTVQCESTKRDRRTGEPYRWHFIVDDYAAAALIKIQESDGTTRAWVVDDVVPPVRKRGAKHAAAGGGT